MTTFFSPSPLPPPIPIYITDEGTMFIPAISSNGETSGTTSSPSSFPSFLDPFNIFSSPPPTPLPLPPPPLPHSIIDSPSQPYDRRKHPSSSPGSAVLLLVGLTGGISLLASSSSFLLLRRSLANSVAHRLNQGTDTTLEEIRSSLSRVEGRLGALEGRIRSGKGGGGGLAGLGQGEGGAGGGQPSSQILLSDLKEEIGALRRDVERKSGEKVGWASGLREDGKGSAKVADVSSSDLRARSPYDFVPPPHSELKTSVVDAPTLASPPAFPPTPVDAFAEQLVTLVEEHTLNVPSSTSVSDQAKVALDNKRSKLEAQAARSWKQAFDKGRSTHAPPPLVRVKDSDTVWADAFKTKQEDVDATNAVGPAEEVVSTESTELEPAPSPSPSSLDQIEDDQAKKLSSNASSSPDDLISSTSSPIQPSTTSHHTSTPIPIANSESPVTSSPIPPTSFDTAPLLESTPLPPPTTTLGKGLDLAASLASRIDSHWYSSTSSSHETSNTRPEAEVEKPPVVDKTKSRKTRARPSPTSTADTSSLSSSSPPCTSEASTPSTPPPPPKSTQEEEPTATSSTFQFGAATTFFPPGIGFAGVYSSPPLQFFGGSPYLSKASGPASGTDAGSEEKSTRGRTSGSKIVDVVTLEGYDKTGALFRSFRRRFL